MIWMVLALQQCTEGGATVRGLWAHSTWCAAPAFDPALLAPIASDLARWWPACPGAPNATAQHALAWAKHGSCSAMDQAGYFRAALALRAKHTPRRVTCLDARLRRTACTTRRWCGHAIRACVFAFVCVWIYAHGD